MSTNQKQADAANLTLVAPSGGVVSGTAYLIGSIFGVALKSEAAGEDVVIQTQGVYALPVKSSDVVAQGDVLYWDDTAKELTKTASGNYRVGSATGAAGSGITTVNAKLDGISTVAEA